VRTQPRRDSYELHQGSALEVLRGADDRQFRCCVTSPPYWALRDYGVDGQIGLEETPEEYVEKLVQVFREVRRVLTDDGTLWLNLGDSYATCVECGQKRCWNWFPLDMRSIFGMVDRVPWVPTERELSFWTYWDIDCYFKRRKAA
jgi:hypothetical protein